MKRLNEQQKREACQKLWEADQAREKRVTCRPSIDPLKVRAASLAWRHVQAAKA